MERFNIFIKSNKFNWTINKIALLIFAILFVAFQINKNFENPIEDSIYKYIAVIGLAFYIGGTLYKFSKIAKPEKLNGKLVGLLEFKLDSIIIDQEQYSIDEIEKISIVNTDFYGKGTGSSRGFDSNLSNGVDNHLTLTLKDKRKVLCMFEIYYEQDIRKIDEILIGYYSLEKMDFNHLIKILKLKRNEIEDFKKIYNIKATSH
ncbi:hypothetical protein SAMN05660845_2531 [Flavobacterium swingsii]|uniref:Uncharacterized protein n=1 Tax=Flavobacterium swingsii TaxID=498292 RepID=A0A1I1A3J3_9FLAO|nr:hypothetical protein [Flavobacterium swingsii]SFB31070.1 hypothetical protein SAMN05660845_2531 [Flavobacterium swingsii]